MIADGHRRKVASATVLSTLVVAACGSLVAPSSGVANSGPLKEARCMRSHGVPKFPDPSPGGPSVIPNWINPRAPAFLSAQKACARFLSNGGNRGTSSAGEKLRLFQLAKCLRAHGLPNFPDPTTSPPPAPPPGAHAGNAIGVAGTYLVFPPRSPALERAEARCGTRVP